MPSLTIRFARSIIPFRPYNLLYRTFFNGKLNYSIRTNRIVMILHELYSIHSAPDEITTRRLIHSDKQMSRTLRV